MTQDLGGGGTKVNIKVKNMTTVIRYATRDVERPEFKNKVKT